MNNPDTDGTANLLNTTSQHLKQSVIIKQYNQQYVFIKFIKSISNLHQIYKDTLISLLSFTTMTSRHGRTIRKQLSDDEFAGTSLATCVFTLPKYYRFRAAQFSAPQFRATQVRASQFCAKLSKFRLNEQESEEPRTQGSTADRLIHTLLRT